MIKPIVRSATLGPSLDKGLNLYKENFMIVFPATALAMVVGGVTCGICSGPMFCGVFAIILALLRGKDPKPAFGDVFNGFSRFLPAFLAVLVTVVVMSVATTILMVVPILGKIAAFLINICVVPTVLAWALLLVTDQDATFGEAITTPFKLFQDKRFWPVALVVTVASLIGGLGAIACGVGVFLTMPLAYCIIAAAYEEVYGGASEGASDEPATPEVLPPAE